MEPFDPGMSRVRIDEASGASTETASKRRCPVPHLDLARQRDREGTLIRQTCGHGLLRLRFWRGGFHRRRRLLLRMTDRAPTAPAQVPMLAVEVIETAFLASLQAAIGVAELLPPGLIAAGLAAIAVSTVAMPADEKHGPANCKIADPLPELEFMSCRVRCRHARWQAFARWTNRRESGTLNPFDVVCATRYGCPIPDLAAPTAGSQTRFCLPLPTRLLQTR